MLGDSWYEWVGEGLGLVVIGLVLADIVPVWSLALACLLLLRPVSRLVMAALRASLEA